MLTWPVNEFDAESDVNPVPVMLIVAEPLTLAGIDSEPTKMPLETLNVQTPEPTFRLPLMLGSTKNAAGFAVTVVLGGRFNGLALITPPLPLRVRLVPT